MKKIKSQFTQYKYPMKTAQFMADESKTRIADYYKRRFRKKRKISIYK